MNFRKKAFFLFVLLLSLCLFCGCGNGAKQAAEAFLASAKAGDAAAWKTVMGENGTDLTAVEQFTLRRMTYKITGVIGDDLKKEVNVQIKTIDCMDLLNDMLTQSVYGDEDAMDADTYLLNRLNSGDVIYDTFSCTVPLVRNGDTWEVDADGDMESLRDALSGGAYSWYQLYQTVFTELPE